MPLPIAIAVIGAGEAPAELRTLAYQVGHAIASRSAVLVCGGLSGVMEAAAAGARAAGGHTIGILPSYDRSSANPHIEFAIATGMGHARNMIVVASADAVIALAGATGTLAEIGLALTIGRPVVALGAWPQLKGVERAAAPEAAVDLALACAALAPRKR